MILLIIFSAVAIIAAAAITYFTGILVVWHDIFKVVLLGSGCFIAANLIFLLAAFIISLFIDAKKHVERPGEFYYWSTTQVVELICIYCRVRTHVRGIEKLPTDRRFLFVSNHRSNLDPLAAMDKLRAYGIAFVSKQENLKIPIVGKFIHKCCFLALDRQNARKALETVNAAAQYLKYDACSIGVYPEGTRSKGAHMMPFHPGSLKIAQKASAPIVVASVSGTELVHSRFPRLTDIYIDILDLIEVDEVKSTKTVDMADKIRRIIAAHLYPEGEEVLNG